MFTISSCKLLRSGCSTLLQLYIYDLKTASETDFEGPREMDGKKQRDKTGRKKEWWRERGSTSLSSMEASQCMGFKSCAIRVKELAQEDAGPVAPDPWDKPIIPDPSTQSGCDL